VAENLENLECSRNPLNLRKLGELSGNSVQPQEKSPDAIFQMQKCFKICLRLGIPDKIPEFSVLPRLPLLPLLFAAIVYEEVSLWL